MMRVHVLHRLAGTWALAAVCAACGDRESMERSPSVALERAWPAGTVLALNGDPILVSDVDAIASIVARAEPQHALPHLRRIALTNVVLPRLAARQVAGEGPRAAALDLARLGRAALEVGGAGGAGGAPPSSAPPSAEIAAIAQGGFGAMGLEVWNWALDAPVGSWSEPIETPGAWRVAQLRQRGTGSRPSDVDIEVDLRTFVWDASATFWQEVEAHLDRSKLEYVDEAWRDLVPTLWQRRLRGAP